MSRSGRRLSAQEAAIWAQVANTVTPLDSHGKAPPLPTFKFPVQPYNKPVHSRPVAASKPVMAAAPPRSQPIGAHGLDTGWDRKLARGMIDPDFTLDLHGCTLDAAHGRLLHGLAQAGAMGARLVLLITGKPRPVDPADRNNRRGAIRAKVIDWLAASDHALDIAAIRGAHRRHGGQGALYIILKRRR
ncbi:MAG: Smr/MutS family protein [Sphingomonadaceae bacterium]|nr:Smr/MutS family protein [Sphingomonadaceae bacterium]